MLNKLQIEFESMVNGIQEIASFVAQCYSSKILISNETLTHTTTLKYVYNIHIVHTAQHTFVLKFEGRGLEKWIQCCHRDLSFTPYFSLSRSLSSLPAFPVIIITSNCIFLKLSTGNNNIQQKNNKYIILLRWTNDFLLEQKHDCIQIVFVCKCKGGRACTHVHTQRCDFYRPYTISMWRKNASIHI